MHTLAQHLDSTDSSITLESSAQASKMPTRAGFVATLGRPNAGKSALLNYLVGEHLSLVSHKANATRKRMQLIAPFKPLNAQIIFIDTPGLHRQEKLLNQYMLKEALKAMSDCDIALFVAPISDSVAHYEAFLQEAGGKRHIIVLSKVDTCPKATLLAKMAEYQKYEKHFLALVPFSIKRGFKREVLLEVIARFLPEAPFYYDSEMLSPELLREIYKEKIRESVFENVSDEIPYESDVMITSFKEAQNSDDIDRIYADIIVEKQSQKAVMIGKDANTIKRISKSARAKIVALSGGEVFLKLSVVVKKAWSKKSQNLKELGYDFTL